MAGYFLGALAAAGLVTAGVAATETVRSADALPAVALANGVATLTKCQDKVLRKNNSAADLREQLPECSTNASHAADKAGGNGVGGEVAGAGAGGGGASAVLPVVLGAVGAGGLAVALGNASKG